MAADNDRDLILALQAGDLDALGALFDAYRAPVFRTVLAMTQDTDVAEDIVQDTFLRMHRYAARLDPERSPLPWLYRVAINLSNTYLRRRARWRVSLDDFIERLVGPVNTLPERVAETHDQLAALEAALRRLSVDQRVVLAMFYLNEMSLQEIAEVLDCPVGTVKSRLHYGRHNLKQQLSTDDGSTGSVGYEYA